MSKPILADRLKPATETRFGVWSPSLALVAGTLLAVLFVAFVVNAAPRRPVAIVGVVSLLVFLANVRAVITEKPMPSIASMFPTWRSLVEALANSPCAAERAHIYLGTKHGEDREIPVMLPIANLMLHSVVNGATGFFKTSKLLLVILLQLMLRKKFSLIGVDLKGDIGFINTLIAWARWLGLKIRLVTLDIRKCGDLWNILADPAFRSLSVAEKTNIVLAAMGLQHGEAYGANFFAAMSRKLLLNLFERFPWVESWRDMRSILLRSKLHKVLGMTVDELRAASHLIAEIGRMAMIPQLNVTSRTPIPADVRERVVTIDSMLNEPGITIFHFPALLDLPAVRCSARFVFQSLVARAKAVGPNDIHKILVFDEAQEFFMQNIKTAIRMCRDLKIALLFAHQTTSDQNAADGDLTDLFAANTSVKAALSVKDASGRDFWRRAGGERIEIMRTLTTSRSSSPTGTTQSTSEQEREVRVSVIDDNVINEVNANPELLLLDCSPAQGLYAWAKPIVVNVPFPQSEADFKQHVAEGWPTGDDWPAMSGDDLVLLLDDDRDDEEPPAAESTDEPKPPKPDKPKRHRKPKSSAEAIKADKQVAEDFRELLRSLDAFDSEHP